MITNGKITCFERNKEISIGGTTYYGYSFIPVKDEGFVQGSIYIVCAEKDKFVLGEEYTLSFDAIQ